MIDADNITNYNLTEYKLEEVLLFWICVAGKTAWVISRNLDKLLSSLEGNSPFDKIRKVGHDLLPQLLKSYGIGCYNLKAKSMWDIVNSQLDLKTCTLEDLENIYGIGPKTSRCFLIHSRPSAHHAGLDTHVLRFLRDMGHEVPNSTPGSKREYRRVENLFLEYVKKSGKTVADFDLEVWRNYRRGVNMT